MAEPVKCPRCKKGDIYERGYTEQYYGVCRNDDGEVFVATIPEGEYYEMACWTCLDCGAIITEDEINELTKDEVID